MNYYYSGENEAQLAKLVETEKFAQKNPYRLETQRTDYIDKNRVTIDVKDVQNVLKHHDQIRKKLEEDVGTFQDYYKKNYGQWDNRVLNVFYDSCVGGMKRLREEMGLTDKYLDIPFTK